MDPTRFDALARALGRPASRRGALGVLVGALALLGEAASGLANGHRHGTARPRPAAGMKRGRAYGRSGRLRARPEAGADAGTYTQLVSLVDQETVLLCHQGHTIEVAAPAAPAHLAQGDTLGACATSAPGSPYPGLCQAKLYGVCTLPSPYTPNAGGCCDKDLACINTATVFITACQLICNTDADCRRKYPHSKLVCRRDLLVCPFVTTASGCCVPG